MSKTVYIVATARTPIGSFMGALATVSATRLGAAAVKAALERANLDPALVDEVIMGNVLTANEGQAPARQAAIFAGLPVNVRCTTVNKVCASGSKAVIMGAQSILLGDSDIVIAGGMESMSNVPFYVDGYRTGNKMGHSQLIDGMIKDGLWDVYKDFHMGNAAEICAKECNITREMQDAFTIESYKRSQDAVNSGKFAGEISPVSIAQKKGDPIVVGKDEEPFNVKFDKIPELRPVFVKDGTVTAANASTINDGAAALVLASGEAVKKYNLKPIARIVSYGEAEKAPEWFTTAPADSIPVALKKAGLGISDISAFEINEAFAVVSLANQQQLGIDPAKLNIWGGAVSLGHPIGCSGARIIITLASVLQATGGRYGVTGICNGGGGASSVVIERV